MYYTQRRSIRYAQNFLHNSRVIDRLIDLSSIGPDDLVVEIGPGAGAITARLIPRCHRVIAVEKDPMLAARLRGRFSGDPRIAIHHADFLRFPLPETRYTVFANIPFNVTTAIVTRLTGSTHAPDDSYLVVQREAAARFLGAPHETLYATLMKPWFEPSVLYRFRPSDFVPAPQVEAVLLRLRKRGPPLVCAAEAPAYRDFVTWAFTTWRPSLQNTLSTVLRARQCAQVLRHAGVDSTATPAAIPFPQWLDLFYHFSALAPPQVWRTVSGAEDRLRRQQATLQKVHRTRNASTWRCG